MLRMSNEFEREPIVIPRAIEHNGKALGFIGVENRTVSGGTKDVSLPMVTIRLPGGLPPIVFAPYVGIANARAKPGQEGEFEGEKRHIRFISDTALNMRTGKRGLPSVVPETEITPTDIRQQVVPAGLSLHEFLNAVASALPDTIDPQLAFSSEERRIDNFSLFRNVVLSKIIAETYRALEELHITSVPTGVEAEHPEKIAVLHHGDLKTHLRNILLVGLPGLNWGKAFIIDLGRAEAVQIDNGPLTSMEDWYQRFPQLSAENEVLGETIAFYFAQRQLVLPPIAISLGQRPYVYQELETYFEATLNALSDNLGLKPEDTFRMVQNNILRAYVHALITSQQRSHQMQQYSLEESGLFAEAINNLFYEEDTPTQVMKGIVNP